MYESLVASESIDCTNSKNDGSLSRSSSFIAATADE